MPDLAKGIDQKIEYTLDNPYQNASPTYVEVPIVRVDGESDRAIQTEGEEAEDYTGRISRPAGRSDFTLMVRKLEQETDTVLDSLIDYDNDGTPIWLRVTPLQPGGIPRVGGGDLGFNVFTTDNDQGFGSYKMKGVRLTGVEANAGTLWQVDPNYTASS